MRMQREWKRRKKKQCESIACREKKSHQSAEPNAIFKCGIYFLFQVQNPRDLATVNL